MKPTIKVIIAIVVILLILTALEGGIQESSNDFVIPGSSCTEFSECIPHTIDCIATINQGYEFAGDIQCIGRTCVCISK